MTNEEKMKAAVLTGLKSLQIKEVSKPRLAHGSLLIKVHSCAVCGSDVRIFESGNSRVKYPAIIGHEIAGEIVGVGNGYLGNLKIGDKVAVGADVPCGSCSWCLNDAGNCCEENYAMGYQFSGGFAEYVKLEPMVANFGPVSRIPEGLDCDQACLAEPLACCINGLERVNFKAGKSVLVIGAGPIGLLLIRAARAFGAPRTMLHDLDAKRLEQGKISNPSFMTTDPQQLPEADIIFVACPSPEAQETAVRLAAKRGAINFFGGLAQTARNINLSSNLIHYRELTVTGSHGSTPRQHTLALDLIASKRVQVSDLITHKYKLKDIEQAFAAVKNRTGLKILVKP